MAENNLGNDISDGIKKIMLAGIGAIAVTAEKSKEIVDALVAQGELTVNQGKVLNAELRRTVEENVAKTDEEIKAEAAEAEEAAAEEPAAPSIIDQIQNMTAEQIAELRAKLDEMAAAAEEKAE